MEQIIQNATERTEKILVKIKQKREEKRYRREEIAEKLGIDLSTYTRIENGDSHLKVKTLFLIAQLLDIDIVALFTDNTTDSHFI
ncbi:helix-turn-helix domain-containing protein [Capnocytophaga leadbetteri]|jgi:transcriptional regulator/helix-turn-helix domain-containing protein|uniref:helix-turn-helix domain-containing protein n=1 Tax=Capnocytophaga leadbetteri TaxID=327575 RepID=UPI0026EE27B9|nr:helix-turn-helix transcriptional regulator [Capnocytophaga leadbetteri]